jgi:tRNA pseudouridine55 synthase
LAELPPEPPAGFLLVDKPAAITSGAAIARIGRERDLKAQGLRIGHAGTLDPFATGLLVVLIGRATRLQRYVLGSSKTYVARARLGWRSSTGDPEGELTETGKVPDRLELPTGRLRQRVPLTSAVRVGGERLYKRAHRGEGEEVERPEREVLVERAELIGSGAGWADFEIVCSAGTYVRTLIEELGDAYCERLRRTAVGHLRLEDAGPELRPATELVSHLAARELSEEEARRVVHGLRLPVAEGEAGGEPLRLMYGERLLAIARPQGGELVTEVVLA